MIEHIVLHKVGNRANDEGILFSKEKLRLDDEIEDLLERYFTGSFKGEEYFHFSHPSDLNLNECYHYASKIFEDPECILDQSVHLANHLYDQSTHPNIKGGEFYVVYFQDCLLDDEMLSAVGLFKSENKEQFLQVYPKNDSFQIDQQEGININKLDKGCLIFNTEKEDGYVVAVVDKTNKNSEALYWVDDFLQAKQREDKFYNTAETMTMYKSFVQKHLPEEFEVSKADQAEMLNRTMSYFKENEEFNHNEFTSVVLEQDEVIDEFNRFKASYQNERDIQLSENFAISDSAVKKQNKAYKSVIKLDKNFHIYVHGDRTKIELGEDSLGKYYKLYFEKEN